MDDTAVRAASAGVNALLRRPDEQSQLPHDTVGTNVSGARSSSSHETYKLEFDYTVIAALFALTFPGTSRYNFIRAT